MPFAYWLPRSEWCTSFDADARDMSAFQSALSTSSVRMWFAIDHPTITTPGNRCRIAELNPVLRGWGGYFRTGNASKHFTALDRFVTACLVRLIGQREGWSRRPFHHRSWPHRRLVHDFGLHRLLGTIRYPGGAHAT